MTGSVDPASLHSENNVLPPYPSNIDPTSFLSTGTYNASQYDAAWTDPNGTLLPAGTVIGGSKKKRKTIKVRKARVTCKKCSKKDIKYKKRGSRKSNKNIDFENMKWGSFTKQFKNYNRQGGNAKNLRDFSHIVLNPKNNFTEKTKDRARFYLNVLDKR